MASGHVWSSRRRRSFQSQPRHATFARALTCMFIFKLLKGGADCDSSAVAFVRNDAGKRFFVALRCAACLTFFLVKICAITCCARARPSSIRIGERRRATRCCAATHAIYSTCAKSTFRSTRQVDVSSALLQRMQGALTLASTSTAASARAFRAASRDDDDDEQRTAAAASERQTEHVSWRVAKRLCIFDAFSNAQQAASRLARACVCWRRCSHCFVLYLFRSDAAVVMVDASAAERQVNARLRRANCRAALSRATIFAGARLLCCERRRRTARRIRSHC